MTTPPVNPFKRWLLATAELRKGMTLEEQRELALDQGQDFIDVDQYFRHEKFSQLKGGN